MTIFKGLSGKFMIPYVLTILFGAWTYYAIRNIRQLEHFRHVVLEVQKSTLEARKEEKDFLARDVTNEVFITSGKSKYLNAHRETVQQLITSLEDLKTSRYQGLGDVDTVQNLLHQYSEAFQKLAKLKRKRGFKDHGLEGHLREAIHAVEDDELVYDRYYMLMLRRHEKDFFLRKDLQYQTKFVNGVTAFKNHIGALTSNDVAKRSDLFQKIDQYEKDFLEIIDLEVTMGLTENEGVHGEMRSFIHGAIPRLDHIAEVATQVADVRVQQNVYALIGLFILIIVIGVVILIYHVAKITRNINVIKDTSLKLAQGRFPRKRKINTNDELGQAHRALNALADGLQAKTDFAESIGHGELSTEFTALGEKDILGYSLISMRDNLKAAISNTQEVIVKAGENGELGTRIQIEGQTGIWKAYSESINLLLQSIATPVVRMGHIINAMAEGDLTDRYRMTVQGDIKVLVDNLNTALENLKSLIRDIELQASQIDEASTQMLLANEEMNASTSEIASAIAQISQGAQSQVNQVEQASAKVEMIMQSADEMAKTSESISTAASIGVEKSSNGSAIIQQLMHAIEEVSKFSKHSNTSMQTLSARSKEISQVLGVITDIASQTNLLALNAAIEAAQAGEYGRGFAVVADEIRKLAEDSRKSVREIERLIEDVQHDTNITSEAIDEMEKRVRGGELASREVAAVFQDISDSSNTTLHLAEEIKSATSKQKASVNNILSITENVVVIAEQTAAGTEESAGATAQLSVTMKAQMVNSKNLSDIAARLKDSVNQFTLEEEATKTSAKSEPVTA